MGNESLLPYDLVPIDMFSGAVPYTCTIKTLPAHRKNTEKVIFEGVADKKSRVE